MTDKEIEKALECCGSDKKSKCRECPLFMSGTDCIYGLLEKQALDYINRLKAENEQLRKDNKETAKEIFDYINKWWYQCCSRYD